MIAPKRWRSFSPFQTITSRSFSPWAPFSFEIGYGATKAPARNHFSSLPTLVPLSISLFNPLPSFPFFDLQLDWHWETASSFSF